MDSATLLASAGISATVSSAVSLLAVSSTTTRQRLAERRDEARQQLSEAVGPTFSEVVKYRSNMRAGLRREDPTTMVGDDFLLASRIHQLIPRLAPVRRWLVKRRCRRIFGPFLTGLAEVSPASDDSLGGMLAPILVAGSGRSELGKMPASDRFGTLHHALCGPPDGKSVTRLVRDLRRLKAGW
jgi:hypothetical protein